MPDRKGARRGAPAAALGTVGAAVRHPVENVADTQAAKLVDLLAIPACVLDGQGLIKHLNGAWRNLAGLRHVTEMEWAWAQLIAPQDAALALLRFQKIGSHDVRSDFECRLRDAAGGDRWFLLSFQPVSRDNPGDWLCTCADIEHLKRRAQELEENSSLQTGLLNVSEDCFKLITPTGALIYMNRAGCEALGVPADSPFGMQWLDLLPEEVRAPGEAALAKAREGSTARFIGQSAGTDGPMVIWDNALTPITGPDGRTTAIFCISRETTGERSVQDALRQSQERLIVAARVGGMGIWDYDIANDALYCDETWYAIVGRDPADPVRSISEFRPMIHPDDVERATEVKQTAAELIALGVDYSIVFRIVRPDGEIRWVRSAACLIQDLGGRPTRAIGFLADATDAMRGEMELRQANRQLEAEVISLAGQAMEDQLTGIANRRFLDSELSRICLRANRTNAMLCVGMIDIDHFKAFNDHYGHQAGDHVLRQVGAALRMVARQSDFVARYGGEEFAFVLPSTDEPGPILDRLMQAIEGLNIPHEKSPSGRITISCGCVIRRGAALMPEALLKAADAALYEAKRGGRDRYVVRN